MLSFAALMDGMVCSRAISRRVFFSGYWAHQVFSVDARNFRLEQRLLRFTQ